MERTLHEIAQLVDGQVVGDPLTRIVGVAAIEDAGVGDIAFVDHAKWIDAATRSQASALLVPPSLSSALSTDRPLVVVDRPRLAFTRLVAMLRPMPTPSPGVHPTARIEAGAAVGNDVSIGAYVVIEGEARIGDRVRLFPHVSIGQGVQIGDDCILHSHVTVCHSVTIGKRVILHPGVVIGSDGFGYEQVDGRHIKVPQAGTVVIEDDVEIGANTTVDRAALSTTRIGQGTKIDNLVQIGHNCNIGKHCVIAAQVGISGSVTVEDGVTVGGQAGFQPHIRVGKESRIGGQAGVISDVPPAVIYSGYPAGPHMEKMRLEATIRRVPELLKAVQRLEAEMKELKRKLLSV